MTLADSSSFSPAVHPRAIRSGQQRYLADTHGYLDRVVGQSALPDLGLQTRPKLHGKQGVNLHWRWQRCSSQLPPATSLRYCRASRSSVGTSLTRLSECPA
jgi:hypothetical protein